MELKIRATSTFSRKGDRPSQEDCAASQGEKGIFVIADGFGGPSAGAAAAKVACESVLHFLTHEAGDRDATLPFVLRSYFSLAGNVLFNALIFANRKLMSLNDKKNIHEKGGASVLGAYLDGNLLALANVGVCSAWLMRGGKSAQLVVPRNYSRLIEPFSEDAQGDDSVPLMAMGMSQDLEPEITEYRLNPGDWLLLSTDGLATSVRGEICDLSKKELDPHQAVQAALECVNKSTPCRDNISISLTIF